MIPITYRFKNISFGAIFDASVATFGENVRRLRIRANKKGAQLAEDIGVSRPVVSKWEKNRTGLPETPTLFRIAKALRCTIEELLEGIDADYDAVRRDLVRQGSDLVSGRPQDVGGSPDVDSSARALPLLQDLVRAIAQQEAHTGKMRELATGLLATIAAGSEGNTPADERPASSDRDRETDR